MADAVVSFLVKHLLQLISENVNLIGGAKEELQKLLEEVRTLQAFLDDAARQESNSSLWKDIVNSIRIRVNRADDLIDIFVVEAKLHERKNLFKRIFDFGHFNRVKNLARDTRVIREQVREIRQQNPHILQPTPLLNLSQRVAREPQDTFLEVTQIVGFNEEANEVMERLVGGTEEIECIPIVGMNGLGKTTLARKVWSDSQSRTEFSRIIWVSVGQTKDLNYTFFVILNPTELYKGMRELANVIDRYVTEQHRCLIVLDDVRAGEVVDFFKNVLPKNKKGHRILMTTRFRDVATYATEKTYHLKFLNPDYSFQLLKKKVFGHGRCPDELVELGKSIASKCGGLPLALVVISKDLKVYLTENNWRRIESNFWQCLVIENDPTSCWEIVEASYKSLSSEMKMCFLYCLAFPKGYDIPVQILIQLWIAERLIKSSPQNSFEEKAESYLTEFEKRDLVIVSRKITGLIKRVKCNDMFYELYKMEVAKECVFQELYKTPGLLTINDPDISRRLHIESSHLPDFISRISRAVHVRSFLCFSSENVDQQASDIRPILKAFPLLRVLKIESINIASFKNFNQLFHLTFISISGDFKELPAFFDEFCSLQSIIINTSQPTLNIKANIWIMSKLTHLKTNKPSKLPLPSTQKGKGTSSIQTLSKISPETCNKDVLGEASNSLKKLSIQGNIEDSLKTNSTFEGFQTFEKFECLENLKLISDEPCHSNAFQFPKALFRFLLKLKKLTLSKTMFDWKEATKLGQLECLEVLKLKTDAFTGKSWNPEKGDFRKLQVLWIHSDDLHTWKASRYHFPKLRVLVLKCPKLESVPAEVSQFQQQS